MDQIKLKESPFLTNEISLQKLIYSLFKKKLFIISFTGFFTFLVFLYAASLPTIYKVNSSFSQPSSSSISLINQLDLLSETKESVFNKFMFNTSSKEFQKNLFIESGYLNKINTETLSDPEISLIASNFIKSIKISPPLITARQVDYDLFIFDNYSISIEGSNPSLITDYLNKLIKASSDLIIDNLYNSAKSKVETRLDEIVIERELLLTIAERDRLSTIERIKEEDSQKIREINDQIDRARFKAKETRLNKIVALTEQIDSLRSNATDNRLNDIVVLTDAARLARSLEIIENNFKLIGDDETNSNLTIAIGENKDLPQWYLYGEKALIERVELLESRSSDDPFIPELVALLNQIELLENRTSDDPFIPELVTLKNQLHEVENNNILMALKNRQRDEPYIEGWLTLLKEQLQLKSMMLEFSDLNAITINELAISPKNPIKPHKKKILILGFLCSFLVSILIASLINVIKGEEPTILK